MQKRLLCCFLFALAVVTMGYAQQIPTTQGKEFWISYMRNGYRFPNLPNPEKEKLIMIASAKRACTVTVRNPNQNWEDSFTVGNNGVATFLVPDARGYNDQYGKSNKGLLVTSTDTISLYIANEAENSYDAANVLPSNALGSQYIIQSNKSIGDQSGHQNENRASFLIVATEDDTQVQITPVCETWDNHAAGNTYTITLQTGECYHILNKNQGSTYNTEGDFSGTIIESVDGKPIAVFNGNCITSIPGGTTSGFDHVFEQSMPIEHWGKRFVVTSTNAPANFHLLNDQVKITALYDNTTVWRDGIALSQGLNAGESCLFEMNLNTDPCSFLSSDNPIAVYLYHHSHRQASGSESTYGDPSMVWISPVEQTIHEIAFSTFQASNGLSHFVNVVCYTESVGELTFDNNQISSYFSVVPSAPEFSYARLDNLTAGAHTIRCPGGFVAYVYGIGPNEGYAYTVGSSAKNLTAQMFINDAPAEEFTGECQEEEVTFRVETNYDIHHVTWDFGDLSYGEGEETVYAYPGPHGSVLVTSVIYRDMNTGVQPFDTLTASFPVFRGGVFPAPNTFSCDSVGTYYDTLQTVHGCDSIVVQTIFPGEPNTLDTTVVVCEQFVFRDSIFTTPGIHEYWVPQVGCDSLYRINLTILDQSNDTIVWSSCYPYQLYCRENDSTITAETTGVYVMPCKTMDGCDYDIVLEYTHLGPETKDTTVVSCDSFFWEANGVTYYDGGDFEYVEIDGDHPTAPDCSTYWHLHLTLNHTPPFNEIKGLSYVAEATNFWPGEYVYFVDDSTGMDTQLIEWELSDNENGEWGFYPHGGSCTVVTYTKGTKELRAKAYSDQNCGKDVSFTINCGGYSVEELDDLSLKVYPNPAREELIIEGFEITNIYLYNLLGQIIKETNVAGEPMVRMEVGDLPQALYLVNVVTRHGNKTQLISVVK